MGRKRRISGGLLVEWEKEVGNRFPWEAHGPNMEGKKEDKGCLGVSIQGGRETVCRWSGTV